MKINEEDIFNCFLLKFRKGKGVADWDDSVPFQTPMLCHCFKIHILKQIGNKYNTHNKLKNIFKSIFLDIRGFASDLYKAMPQYL